MSFDKKTAEKQACNIYCELSKLRSLLRALELASEHSVEISVAPGTDPVDWGAVVAMVKKEVTAIASLAEDLERSIRCGKGCEDTQEADQVTLPVFETAVVMA